MEIKLELFCLNWEWGASNFTHYLLHANTQAPFGVLDFLREV